MKKFMTVLLGLSLALGTVAFGEEATKTEKKTTKKAKKTVKKVKKTTEEKK